MAICRCRVSGKVQGVGFRYWTAETARALNLTGWVCNRPDGSVELEAHGTDSAVRELQKQLWQGPAFSNVTEVSCSPASRTTDEFTDFTIRR